MTFCILYRQGSLIEKKELLFAQKKLTVAFRIPIELLPIDFSNVKIA